jgi:hypothetical protein
MIEQARAREARGDLFGLMPGNVPAVELFLLGATQWRIAGDRRVGLDYSALKDTYEMAGHAPAPDAFAGVRIMEAAALRAWSEARS